jgi:hypothetical protein
MPTEPMQLDLLPKLQQAIADHVAGREDRHGFSSLDVLLADIAKAGTSLHSDLEAALLKIIPELPNADERAWEAVRMIIEAAGIASSSLRTCIEKYLDQSDVRANPEARFQALASLRAAGGTLTRPQLNKEIALREQLTPLWMDLIISTCQDAPEAIISAVEQLVATDQNPLSWEDVRRRLPILFKLLGPHFNRGIHRIVGSMKDPGDRYELADAVDQSFQLNLVDFLKNAEKEGAIESAIRHSSSGRINVGVSKHQHHPAHRQIDFAAEFARIVLPGLRDWRSLRTGEPRSFEEHRIQ